MTEIVQEFDKLCDEIIETTIYMAKNMGVKEKTYLVEKTKKILQ